MSDTDSAAKGAGYEAFKKLVADYRDARDQLRAKDAEIERLRALAADAIEEVEFWATYANDYFRDKHGYAPTIGALKSRLAALKEQDQ